MVLKMQIAMAHVTLEYVSTYNPAGTEVSERGSLCSCALTLLMLLVFTWVWSGLDFT